MMCETCGGLMRVIDSRPRVWRGREITYRRRACDDCGRRETTYEIPEQPLADAITEAGGAWRRQTLTEAGA